MARDQARRPVSDEDLDDVREAIREQREEIRAYLEAEGVALDDRDE